MKDHGLINSNCDGNMPNGNAQPAPEPAADPMNYKGMFLDAVKALAQIDALLGLPEDGCNDPQVTVSALADYIAGAQETAKYRDQWVDAQFSEPAAAVPEAAVPEAVEAAISAIQAAAHRYGNALATSAMDTKTLKAELSCVIYAAARRLAAPKP